jgi:hypothetical protein
VQRQRSQRDSRQRPRQRQRSQGNNTRPSEPGRKDVKTWERIETILDVSRNIGKLRLDVRVAIEQPTFADDTKGFQKITATIGIDSHFIRLNTRAFGDLIDLFDMHHEKFSKAIGRVHEANDKIRAEREESGS